MFLKRTFPFILILLFSNFCLANKIDTLKIQNTNTELIIYTFKNNDAIMDINFVLFDGQYLYESFYSTLNYWLFFEDIKLNYKIISVNQKNRSNFNNEDYLKKLDSSLTFFTKEEKSFNVFISHSAGSFFILNLLNRKHNINSIIMATPSLRNYVPILNFDKIKSIYISSSKNDSFNHDKYFKKLKKSCKSVSNTQFDFFIKLNHVNLFHPSIYNGLTNTFNDYYNPKINLKEGEEDFSPLFINKIIADSYNKDTINIDVYQYYYIYLKLSDQFSKQQNLNYIDYCLKLYPNDIQFLFAKGNIFYDCKEYKKALSIYELGYSKCIEEGVMNLDDFETYLIKTRKKIEKKL
jgi:tetratricopeptide (TPR) repeat protein